MAKDDAKPRRKPGRVPTSCAECRRLKLRCDKNVPCEKCVSRGCGAICPEGSLTTGKGSRLVLANTEQLHDRIDDLCSRIRELETALKVLQATVSPEPHPLLRADLLQIKSPESVFSARQKQQPNGFANGHAEKCPASTQHIAPVEEENFIDAFGTLTIGTQGETNFLGKTARSEYLIRVLSKPQLNSDLALPRLSRKILNSYCPEREEHDQSLGSEVFELRPPLSEAIRLCELYLDHGRYLYHAIPRQQLFDEVLMSVYRTDAYNALAPLCYYKLSLLFSIFSLGALFDPGNYAYSVESREYSYLAKAAFGPFSTMNRNATLEGMQAMIHMFRYAELSDWEALGSNGNWIYLGAAIRIGQSIGLHLNPARWNLCDDLTQRRSSVFWQLFTADAWLSFEFGRPPMICPQFTDCPLPVDPEPTIDSNGAKLPGFHSWIWQYTTLMHTVMTTAFGSKNPQYNVILEMDRKIRDFPVPLKFQLCGPGAATADPVHYMQRWSVLMSKETVLLHLHRAYFAQALQEQPEDLTRHRYLPSVMAAYRSAWRMIQGLRMVRVSAPMISERVSMCWSHALTGAIAMCILVTRAPTSKMAKPSLSELDTVATLFEEAAATCKPASTMVDMIKTLQRKAHDAVEQQETQDSSLSPAELDRLGGKTHLLSSDSAPSSPEIQQGSTSSSSTTGSSPSQQQPSPSPSSPSYIHPTITADMRLLDNNAMDVDFAAIMSRDMFDLPATDFMFEGLGLPGMDMGQNSSLGVGLEGYSFGNGGVSAGMPVTPLLDATWQSFVEQLGF